MNSKSIKIQSKMSNAKKEKVGYDVEEMSVKGIDEVLKDCVAK